MFSNVDKVNSVKKEGLSSIAQSESSKSGKDDNKDMPVRLIKESQNYNNSSKQKQEEAQKYLSAANALDQMAHAVRQKAADLRSESTGESKSAKKADPVKEAAAIIKNEINLEVPVPKDATPEQLESMADDLHRKAMENRKRADDLLIDSEKDKELSKSLQKQADLLNKKQVNLDKVSIKSMQAQQEGLDKVFKMLGIAKLDNMYRDQVAMSAQKSREVM